MFIYLNLFCSEDTINSNQMTLPDTGNRSRIAFIMISVAMGSLIFSRPVTSFSLWAYYFLFIFSIGFVIFTIYSNGRKKLFFTGAYRWRNSIRGLTFLIIACVAEWIYMGKGFVRHWYETLAYAFSISMIRALSYICHRKIEVNSSTEILPGAFNILELRFL